MSLGCKHKEQLEHNEEFIKELDGDKFKDWAITGYFYCALHAIEYFFAEKFDVHTRNHSDRHSEMYVHDSCTQFRREYEQLYDLSIMSRYDCIDIRDINVWDAEQCFLHIKQCAIK